MQPITAELLRIIAQMRVPLFQSMYQDASKLLMCMATKKLKPYRLSHAKTVCVWKMESILDVSC